MWNIVYIHKNPYGAIYVVDFIPPEARDIIAKGFNSAQDAWNWLDVHRDYTLDIVGVEHERNPYARAYYTLRYK